MRPGAGAVLVPAINAAAWEQGLGCRVALFRDWGWDDDDGNVVHDVRFAEVIKAEGTNVPDGRRNLVAFVIREVGSPVNSFCHLGKGLRVEALLESPV
jgi:hypothetical protein